MRGWRVWTRRLGGANEAATAPRVLDGEAEAQLLAIACSEPPEGCARWTLHLLVEELKTRRIVASVSHETVRQVLKKRRQTLRRQMWCIPPKHDAAFVCAMEQVLDVYNAPA